MRRRQRIMPVQWGLIGGDIVRKRVGAALRESARSRLLGVARADARLTASFGREVDAVLAGREPAVRGEIGRAVALVEQQIYGDDLDPARC